LIIVKKMGTRKSTKPYSKTPDLEDASHKPVTIRDMAHLLDCSPTTISLVLNNHPLAKRIAAATKQRIHAAVKETGYVPIPTPSLLRKNDTHIIGIMCPDITDPFCNQVVQGSCST